MRKLLNSLYIIDETAYLTLDGENVVCKSNEQEKYRIPFSNIEDITCFNYSGCTPALMGKCVEYGIPISFISPYGKFEARVIGEAKGNVHLRKMQFDKFSSDNYKLIQNTVATKLSNTRFLLRRSLRDNPQIDDKGEISDVIKQLETGIESVYYLNDKETIMGTEGNCAKAYFSIFEKLILNKSNDFRMTARTKRPPLDRVNAMLSFLYAVQTSWVASSLESVGLDSYCGFYHSLRSGRCSLACDLVEELRNISERLVLTMINLKMITADDFDVQVSGAVFLNKDGRKKVVTAWQERKRSIILHPFLNEKIPVGLIPYVQSSLLAKHIRGEIEEYPNFIMK